MVVDRDGFERVVLGFTVFVVLFAQMILYPGIYDLVVALGADEGNRLNAGIWFLGVEFASFIVFAVIWGVVSDSWGVRRPLIMFGALVGGVGYLSLGVIPLWVDASFAVYLLIRVVQSAATIGAFSLSITMLMDSGGSHGRNMGAAGMGIGLGVAMGAPIGGFLYELGVFVPLYASGLLLVIAGSSMVLVGDRAVSGGRGYWDVFEGVMRKPELLLPFSFGFVDRFTAGFFALTGTFFIIEVFELSPAETGVTLGFFFAPFALLQYPFGRLSDVIGRLIPIVIGSVVYGLGIVLVGFSDSVFEARMLLLGVGVLGALVAPATMALVTDMVSSEEYGSAMAGFNVFGSLGFLAGIVVGGFVADLYSYQSAFVVAGLSEIVIVFVLLPFLLWYDVSHGGDEYLLRPGGR